MLRRRKLTKAEIEERLQEVSDGMLNASLVHDEKTYYELFEERGELRHMLEQLRSVTDQIAKR